tara:strand:- start:1234 stop:2034 length:801 start_codon:yes stop_codon:yes gene_type:complete
MIKSSFKKRIFFWLLSFGFNVKTFINFIPGFFLTTKNYITIKKQINKKKNIIPISYNMPYFNNIFEQSGYVDSHYFYQDNFIATEIYKNNPKKHVDIGSRIDGFISMVSIFRKVEVFDIRPLNIKLDNVIFKRVDVLDENFNLNNYCDSLSCLHTLEHFGLGRYGDDINIESFDNGFSILHKILKKNGILYLSVPIGFDKIEFNAHRVTSIKTLLSMIKNKFSIISFSFVDDNGLFFKNVKITKESVHDNFGCDYGCGIFLLKKII